MTTVFKVGGSLFERADLREQIRAAIKRTPGPALLVPGGGPIADGVRQVHAAQVAISNETAHRAAFVSLGSAAVLLSELLELPVVSEWDQRTSAVADPLAFLERAGRFGELSASWDVTSDSIAALIANCVAADGLILLKSCPCPAALGEAIAGHAVDRYFPQLMSGLDIQWCDLTATPPAITTTGWSENTAASGADAETASPRDLIAEALVLAATAHAVQTRKGNDVPYITHPVEVCRVLREHGFGESRHELHAAALLHDAVEDTPVTLEEIRTTFGNNVADWVDWTSEIKVDAAGQKRSWKDRKAEHVERLRQAPWQACAITLADKIHNLRDTLAEPRDDSYWSVFNAPPNEMVWYQSEVSRVCERGDLLSRLAETHRELVDRLRAAVR